MGILGRAPDVGQQGPSRKDRKRMRDAARARARVQVDNERRVQVIILGIVGFLAVVVVGLAAYGYYEANVKPEQETAIRVGERQFNVGYVERRLSYSITSAVPGDLELMNAEAAVTLAYAAIVNEEVDRQGARQLGISVTEDEIDANIRLEGRIPESADTDAFAEAYRNLVKSSGLHPNEYREMVSAELLEQKLRQHFRDQIPATAEQLHLRVIRLGGQTDADEVLTRLQQGEDFAALAGEVSLDTTTKNSGGDLGWVPRGVLKPDVEEALFALEVGQLSETLYRDTTYYIYQVLEKAADKEVTTEQRGDIEDQALERWRVSIAQGLQITRISQEQYVLLYEKAVEKGSAPSNASQ